MASSAQKTLAIIGMGPKLGMAVARRFGREGYQIGLVARNADKLASYVAALSSEGIDASYFVADVCNRPQLIAAIDKMKKQLGPIDALEYSPMINGDDLRSAIATTPDSVMPMMDHIVYGAITAVNCVIDEMVARGNGTLLFTMGSSAVAPLPSHTNVGIAMAGLHRYVETLNISLSDTGVYAGNFVIGELLAPEAYADILWDMTNKRQQASVLIGDPIPLAAFETLVARGYAQPHPAKLIQPLPAPDNNKERNTFLLALFHAHMNATLFDNSAEILKFVEQQVALLNGDINAHYFGAANESQA